MSLRVMHIERHKPLLVYILSVRLTKDELGVLNRLVRAEQRSASDVVRAALAAYALDHEGWAAE